MVVSPLDPTAPPAGWTGAQVQQVLAAVAAAHPQLARPGDNFLQHLTNVVDEDAASRLEQLRIADLYLAFACCRGDEDAIATFEELHGVAITAALRRARTPADAIEDLRQVVRRHLLVGDRPALASYKGRGSLTAWAGVVALRTAMNATRGKPRPVVPLEETSDLASLGDLQDPELDYLRARYHADFRTAFAKAVTELPARERSLLHQHLVEKLTVREIGRIYGVNSGTVARWLVRARELLAEHTTTELRVHLRVTPVELDSIMRLIRSRVDLSLSRVFGDVT
jgi:RNA polymerase sigma-70 factor (ECF subfamily)